MRCDHKNCNDPATRIVLWNGQLICEGHEPCHAHEESEPVDEDLKLSDFPDPFEPLQSGMISR